MTDNAYATHGPQLLQRMKDADIEADHSTLHAIEEQHSAITLTRASRERWRYLAEQAVAQLAHLLDHWEPCLPAAYRPTIDQMLTKWTAEAAQAAADDQEES